MAIFHTLNVADLFFMAIGVATALLMIAMGGNEERRKVDRLDGEPTTKRPARRVRRG
jgi:hypothetical protein